jgi:hypothetical protein
MYINVCLVGMGSKAITVGVSVKVSKGDGKGGKHCL